MKYFSIYNQANEKVLLLLGKSYESISMSLFTLKIILLLLLLLKLVLLLVIVVVVGTL